jgi:tryptophan 2,3-dioxygenase
VTTPQRRGAGGSSSASSTRLASPSPRNFGEEGGLLTYGSYLRLPELLAQQVPQADPPAHDELLFITVHQVYELWFGQLLHELEAVRDAMTAGETWRARHLLRRVHAISRLLIAQVDILETMTPGSAGRPRRNASGCAAGWPSRASGTPTWPCWRPAGGPPDPTAKCSSRWPR